MRVWPRFVPLVLVIFLSAVPLFADHFLPECPLTLVGTDPAESAFALSPHAVFRSGNQVFVLRGQVLSTYAVNDIGELLQVRQDFMPTLAARESSGGVAFSAGHLFVSSEAGLEIFDLRNVRAGGSAPVRVSQTHGFHFRRMAINGNTLVGVYPSTDLLCHPTNTTFCSNVAEVLNITNLGAPHRVGTITTLGSGLLRGINDVAFVGNFLVLAAESGTFSFNMNNPMAPLIVGQSATPGTFLVSNAQSIVGVGNDTSIDVLRIAANGVITDDLGIYHVPGSLRIDRANPVAFSRQAWFDEAGGRLITMINEINPLTLRPARTIAFDVFDFTVPSYEGSDPRPYESISFVDDDEVKHNPIAVGPYVYVVGEMTGLQTWGSCNQITGRIDWDGTAALSCGGASLHGWVTGTQRLTNVEVFLDGTFLGADGTFSGSPRLDVFSRTPVLPWRVNVNLDNTPRGERLIRAVGTDAFGNRRQFASVRVFFPGPGQNCGSRRRLTAR